MLRKNFHSAGPQSNVTRMARCLKRKCHDGTPQVIVYDPGVGSSASKVDQWFGGAFGMGLEQNIREMYNFICNNFVDGDEIILIGFSRGAFTARSVADLIGTIGLLTPEGQDYFNSIFKDYENIADTDRDLDKYLTKLDPFVDEGDGSKAEWVAKRKRAYVKFLKGAGVSHFWSSCFSPCKLETDRGAVCPWHPRQQGRARSQDQGHRCLGYRWYTRYPSGSPHGHPWFR